LFLDPNATHHLKAVNGEIGLEAVFTKDFARLNPAKVRPRALSNKIADCSTQYADIKEQENPGKDMSRLSSSPKQVRKWWV